MNEPFFEKRSNNNVARIFDKRGVFLIVGIDKVYVWIGSRIYPNVKNQY